MCILLLLRLSLIFSAAGRSRPAAITWKAGRYTNRTWESRCFIFSSLVGLCFCRGIWSGGNDRSDRAAEKQYNYTRRRRRRKESDQMTLDTCANSFFFCCIFQRRAARYLSYILDSSNIKSSCTSKQILYSHATRIGYCLSVIQYSVQCFLFGETTLGCRPSWKHWKLMTYLSTVSHVCPL